MSNPKSGSYYEIFILHSFFYYNELLSGRVDFGVAR